MQESAVSNSVFFLLTAVEFSEETKLKEFEGGGGRGNTYHFDTQPRPQGFSPTQCFKEKVLGTRLGVAFLEFTDKNYA